jgi:drug/metabolite transporter (DMT)-like permease
LLAVALALLSAALFGAMTVALRFGFRDGRAPDAELGAFVCTASAALVAALAAIIDREATELSLRDAAFFALAGLIAPGASQLFFTRAVRDAGPSRTSVVVGTAPLFAAAMAIVFLDEPIEAPLVIGGLLVVAAGLILVSEPTRPEHVRMSGIALAFAATLLFTSRDNLVRWYSGETSSGSVKGAAVAMTAGALGTLVFLSATRRRGSGPMPA